MRINDRTKGYALCTAEAMLLGATYAWASHVYFWNDKRGAIDAETREELGDTQIQERIKNFYSIFRVGDYRVSQKMAKQYLIDYGPQP